MYLHYRVSDGAAIELGQARHLPSTDHHGSFGAWSSYRSIGFDRPMPDGGRCSAGNRHNSAITALFAAFAVQFRHFSSISPGWPTLVRQHRKPLFRLMNLRFPHKPLRPVSIGRAAPRLSEGRPHISDPKFRILSLGI